LTRVGRRTGVLLVVVVIGHVALISAQVNNPSGVRLFEGVTFGLFSEIQRAVSSTVGRVTWFWSGYVGLQSVHAENTVLRKDVAELQFRLQRERALAQRARGLEELLELRRNVDVSTVSARVIAGDATPYFRTVTIDRGSPASRASKVQLLVDRSAAAGALIERTRVAGLVMGDVDEGVLRMEYVSNLEDVVIGDVVVTSGVDGIYPKGFVIGVVEVVQRGVGLDKTILVRPAVVFSDLEDVLVIVHDQPLLTTAAGGG
jgi:rod shape-determining protein MreC